MHCKGRVSMAFSPKQARVAGVPRVSARKSCSVQQLHSLELPWGSTGMFVPTAFCDAHNLSQYLTSTLTSFLRLQVGHSHRKALVPVCMSLIWRLLF